MCDLENKKEGKGMYNRITSDTMEPNSTFVVFIAGAYSGVGAGMSLSGAYVIISKDAAHRAFYSI